MENAERTTRDALEWAIQETVLRLPSDLHQVDEWEWDQHDLSLFSQRGDNSVFRFHVAAKRLASRKLRIAVMTITDDHGTVTWEADLPTTDQST